jgi:hypothetical protein
MARKLRIWLLAVLALPACAAGAPVKWSTTRRVYPVHFHPELSPEKKATVSVRNVVLENEHVRIEAAPELAGRVMHVTYKATGQELFNVLDSLRAYNVWDAGGWRVSFPFYEHGMRFRGQTAGWRVVEGDGGEVTLAMEMRFARFREPAELNYKGRFSDLRLGRWLTLRPGQAYFECTMRVENPLPYRVGLRLWTTAQLPLADAAEFVFPVRRMCYHGAVRFSDWRGGEGAALWRNWQRTDSYFAVNLRHPFVGVYYPSADVNRVRIVDPKAAPGAKLYAWGFHGRERAKARFFEVWGGLDPVFEQDGRFLPAFAAAGFTERWYLARRIGRADYANEHAAVALRRETRDDGTAAAVVSVTPSRDIPAARIAAATTRRAGINAVARRADLRPLAAEKLILPLRRPTAPVTVTIHQDGRKLLEVTLPPDLPPRDEKLEERMRERVSPDPADLRRWAEHGELRGWIVRRYEGPGLPTTALPAARAYVRRKPKSAEARVMLGRIAYRLGDLDTAAEALEKAVALDAESGIAHHLLGLVLLERGKAAEAGPHFWAAAAAKKPHPAAGYFVALGHVAGGRYADAARRFRSVVAAAPEAVRPRLLLAATLARLGDLEEARRIAARLEAEDPSSVEIAEVAARSFPDDAARRQAVQKLLEQNPEAEEALRRLRQELDEGKWSHPKRPGPYRYVGGHRRLQTAW